MSGAIDPRLILLGPGDNSLVACAWLEEGETIQLDGVPVRLAETIAIGHKIARVDLAEGTVVMKYGAPIGSTTEPVARGRHLHIHNLKSDYIPTYTVENVEAYYQEAER